MVGYPLRGVWLAVAGGIWQMVLQALLDIFCMTGWWGIYQSKKKDDMLWPDMTWKHILTYDIWNFGTYVFKSSNFDWCCSCAISTNCCSDVLE